MKTFQNRAAQGDLLIRRIAKLPDGIKQATEVKHYIVAHSETGHHHVIDVAPNVKYYPSKSFDQPSYLEVVEATDATEVLIRHLRDYDTHESLKVPAGVFELRNQREYTPEGWRKAQD
jgi:hypothetical protein